MAGEELLELLTLKRQVATNIVPAALDTEDTKDTEGFFLRRTFEPVVSPFVSSVSFVLNHLATFGEDAFHLGMRPRDDVDRDELANPASGGGARVGGRLDSADVATHQDGDVTGPDVFLGNQHDVCRLHHRVCCLDRSDQSTRFNHPECFGCQCGGDSIISMLTLPDRGVPSLLSAEE